MFGTEWWDPDSELAYSMRWSLEFQGTSIAACPRTNKLVITQVPGTFHVFSLAQVGRVRREWFVTPTWEPEASWQDAAAMPRVHQVAFAADGTLFAVTQSAVAKEDDWAVSIVDVTGQSRVGVLWAPAPGSGLDCWRCSITARGDLVAVGLPAAILVFKQDSDKSWTQSHVLSKNGRVMAFSACGTRLARTVDRMCMHMDTISAGDKDPKAVHLDRVLVDRVMFLESYGQSWVAADSSGCVCVVREHGLDVHAQRITHGNTRPRGLAHVPGLGIFVADRDQSLVLLQDGAHRAMGAMSPIRGAWMGAVARAPAWIPHRLGLSAPAS